MKLSMTRTLSVLLILCCPTSGIADARPLEICINYHCKRTVPVILDQEDQAQLRALFWNVETPEQERHQLRLAIALLEDTVGRLTGTWRDLGKNAAGAGKHGQLDCIAESKNTTSYLKLMDQDGLLRWHRVLERTVRHPWILDFHWTAVIEDQTSGIRYAVDSWYLDNGQPPYIQKLDDWLVKRRFPQQTNAPDT